MQNLYFAIPLIVGIVLIAVGLAPLGIPLALVAVVAGAIRHFRGGKGELRPGEDAHTEEGPGTGYAYKGQAHMTPDSF